ncbi:MAG: hypothetical protein A2018_00470 [Alphaproteobacteria bacterium GWF2_58_20]|nr:MAG: hypothetical protein A2018_00470 [Alphaproteobacteria bacterium GWF2_58_20]
MHWYIDVLKKYTVFNGRATRQEFWMFTLMNLIVSIGIGLVARLISLPALNLFYMLAILLPSLALSFRRLHDTDRSGWWMLLAFIPILGIIAFIVLMCLDSTPGNNRFGANPKGIAASATPTTPEAPVVS